MAMKNITTNTDRMWCYAAFALVMERNEAKRASELVGIIQREFPRFTKLIYADNLAQALSCHGAAHIFTKERQKNSTGQVYCLVPKFYSMVLNQACSEISPLLKGLEEEIETQEIVTAGIRRFYQRQVKDYSKPTMMSVFRQAREIYEGTRR